LAIALAGSLVVCGTRPSRAGDPTGADILAKARTATDRIVDKTQHLAMRTIAPSGSVLARTLQGFEKQSAGGRRILWIFEEPADMNGTRFLALQPKTAGPHQLWVYFPAQRRVRQVADQLRHERFQGSDFTYEDLAVLFYFDYAGDHRLRGEESCGDGRCWVIDTTLPAGAFAYTRVVSWLHTETLLPDHLEFSDAEGELKEITVKRSSTVDGIPTILAMDVRNARDGYRTTVECDRVQYNRGLADDLFTIEALSRGK
jgi:hypothetical protein